MNRRFALVLALAACTALAFRLRAPAGAQERSPGPAPGRFRESPASQRFSVDTPEKMQQARRGVAAIQVRNNVRASGFLIKPDLIATCRHCIEDQGSQRPVPPSDLYVRFDHLAGDMPGRAYPVLDIAYVSKKHDFALLRIGPDDDDSLPAASSVLRLAAERTKLDTPVYIWSHDLGRPMTLADGGSVLFPHRATPRELLRIENRLRAELKRAGAVIADVQRAYGRATGGSHHLISPIWARQPIHGIEARVDHGSSGAPVIDKQTHEVIGMLFAGPDRGPHPADSSWHEHQAVLPAAVIKEVLVR